MGRLEKVVVFTVLFLVAAILGISLSTEPDADAHAGAGSSNAAPRTPAERRQARDAALRGADTNAPSASGSNEAAQDQGASGRLAGSASGAPAGAGAPGGVMSTSLAPRDGAGGAATPATAQAQDAALVAGAGAPSGGAPSAVPANPPAPQPSAEFLVSRAGLTPTASDEFMSYSWQAGDSFRALAQRYYGSPLHAKRLRDANEGRAEAGLAAGDRILVAAKPTADGDRLARPSARETNPADKGASAVVGGTYTVAAGDVLGTISQKVYGSATKWRKLYDANRDVIGADPNQLKPGMVLRIPQ